MDIEIVNTILQLCTEQQTCLFEIASLCDYCREQNRCANMKYILASIRNYTEIFQISRDQNRIELFMPFEICRKKCLDGTCSNVHLCYEHFYTNACRRSSNCPSPHVLTASYHEDVLGSLINLDLDLLSKAFRVYCQANKHLVNHNSSKMNTWRAPEINGNSSWRIKIQPLMDIKSPPRQQILEKGLQICWKSAKDIPTHFIEVVFSNQTKSEGGPIQAYQIYQHLGVAQVFYDNLELPDRVVLHGPVTFQSFTFIPRLLHRIIDSRHLCLSNMPLASDQIDFYIDTISQPYRKIRSEYYQNDQQMMLIQYNEDIDFTRILSNIRNHPECEGSMIHAIQIYLPEVLFIEHDQEYTEEDMSKLFVNENIFHIKTYSHCSFVHFYSHDDLQRSITKTFPDLIRVTPIYIDIYSQRYLNEYLQRREVECQSNSTMTPPISSEIDSPLSIPILPPPPPSSQSESLPEENPIETISDDDEDDLHDLPSEFDDDDFFLDETTDNNGDMEFLRNAAKNLMTSLNEMEEASATTNMMDAPRSLLYGDDYIVTIKNRRFALAFLDYTQFRVEKQRNPDRFRLLASLRQLKNNKKRLDNAQSNDQTIETKSNNKKRSKRNRKKKTTNNNNDDQDNEIQLTNE